MPHMSLADRPAVQVLWWAYFALVAFASVGGVLGSTASPFQFASSLFNAFALVGLWGYLQQIRIGSRPFWVAYFLLSVALSAVSLTLVFNDAERQVPAGVFAVLLVLVLPLYFALWRYAFACAPVWVKVGDA